MDRESIYTDLKVPVVRVFRWIALATLAAMILLFTVGYGFAPHRLVKEYELLSKKDSLFLAGFDPAMEHPALISLVKAVSFKKSLLELSSRDSIHLVVDLRDSTVCLFIHGVFISRIKAAGMVPDPVLNTLGMKEYMKIFSRPLAVVRQQASVIKEPVVVRHAPRDTMEAFLNAYLPDTLVQRPAFMELKLEHGIRIVFEQDRDAHFRDRRVRSMFRLTSSAGNTLRYFSQFFTLHKMKYSPKITIRMDADNIRAIYRALPSAPCVAIAH